MKKIALVAAISSLVSLPTFSLAQRGQLAGAISISSSEISALKHIRSSGTADLSNPAEREAVISRLQKMGYTPENRPHLFQLLSQPMPEKAHHSNVTDMAVKNTRNQSCIDSTDRICEVFFHTGFSVRSSKAVTKDKHLVFGALYSENDPTVHSVVDIALIDENFHDITRRKDVEFFGDDAKNQKRKAIETTAFVSQSLVNAIARSEKIYADAWIEVTKIDENGKESISIKNIMVEYNKEAMLELIASPVTSGRSFNKSVMEGNNVQQAWVVKQFSHGDVSISPFDTNVVSPISKKMTPREEELGGDRIIVCLNRNYGDCDYDNIYDHSYPTNKLLLKVPFEGDFEVRGKVTTIYGVDNFGDIVKVHGHDANAGNYPTNIYIQTKEDGGAYPVTGDPDFTEWYGDFVKHLRARLNYNEDTNKTIISWKIERDDGVFGNADKFTRYEDAHWFMNFVFDTERRPSRPPSLTVHGIGSHEPEGYSFYELPVMQFVKSCLAKGSLITLANGQKVAIETIKVGDTVLGSSEYTPNQLIPLTVEDVSIGVELIPMFEVSTDKGHKLLLTESHPVVNQSGQSIWAKHLSEGDRIQVASNGTSTDSALITSIKEVEYKDSVYNLKLARPVTEDTVSIDHSESFNMVANGMVVGDLNRQNEVAFHHKEETTEDVLNRLPQAWHQDYMNSLD